MGAIKPNNYTEKEISISLIADAISHPLRTRIIQMLQDQEFLRNVDLSKVFSLNETTIKNHLDKLKKAGLIYYDYNVHYYQIRLNSTSFSDLKKFIQFEDY
jgi:DNA-binding transcriptional ArsR family regulator